MWMFNLRWNYYAYNLEYAEIALCFYGFLPNLEVMDGEGWLHTICICQICSGW